MEEINMKTVFGSLRDKINDIGIRVKEVRKKRGLTQQELAFYLLTDKCLISELERGHCNNITALTLIKIAEVLEVDVDYLFSGNKSTKL
jgi:transcriptional regulator with XRE-family HTH domain